MGARHNPMPTRRTVCIAMARGMNTMSMLGAFWVKMAKAARTGRLRRYCTPLDATLRTIHSSRGTFVDRPSARRCRARGADVTPC
jgi:hypothetical protein